MASIYMRLSESHVVPRLPLYSVPVCTLQKAQGHKGETGAGYVDVMQPRAVGRTGIAEVPASIHPIAPTFQRLAISERPDRAQGLLTYLLCTA